MAVNNTLCVTFDSMKPTQEQIDLIDKLFLIVLRPNKGLKPGPELTRKELQVPKDLFKFLYNTMCEIGHKEEILIARQFGYGDYDVVRIDYIKSKLFIDEGGFKGYFERENSSQRVFSDTTIINNSGNIENLVQNVKSVSANGSITQNISKPIIPKSTKSYWLKIIYWIATICLALIAIYSLIKGIFNK